MNPTSAHGWQRAAWAVVCVSALSGDPAIAGVKPALSLHFSEPGVMCDAVAESIGSCDGLDATGNADDYQLVHVIVSGISALNAIQFGVDYPASVAVLAWSGCGGQEIASDGWPGSGSGIAISWTVPEIQLGSDSLLVIGHFFVAPGSDGLLAIVDPPDGGPTGWIAGSGELIEFGSDMLGAGECSGHGEEYVPCGVAYQDGETDESGDTADDSTSDEGSGWPESEGLPARRIDLRTPIGTVCTVDGTSVGAAVLTLVSNRSGTASVNDVLWSGTTARLSFPADSLRGRVFLHGEELEDVVDFRVEDGRRVLLNDQFVWGEPIPPEARPISIPQQEVEKHRPVTRAMRLLHQLSDAGLAPEEIKAKVEDQYGAHVQLTWLGDNAWSVYKVQLGYSESIRGRRDSGLGEPARSSSPPGLLDWVWVQAQALLRGRVLIFSNGKRLSVPSSRRDDLLHAIDQLRTLDRPIEAQDLAPWRFLAAEDVDLLNEIIGGER